MTTAPLSQTGELLVHGARPPLPVLRDVLLEQVRAIGFTLRLPMLIAAVLALLVTLVLAIQIVSGNMEKHLLAEPSSLPGIIGALLPVAIWAREERFGPAFLWTLPVDRSRHALIKVLAGWLWLVAGLALYAFCQLMIALVSEGGVMPVKTMYVLTTPVPGGAPLDPSMLRIVRWAPGPIVWAIPVAAATATYLLASAFMVGIRHPLRWVVGAAVAVPIATIATHAMSRLLGVAWLSDAPTRAVSQLVYGSYGLETLLTLRTWSLDNSATLPSGERIQAWSAIPNLADWRIAALLWTTAGLLALWVAAARHREQRRAAGRLFAVALLAAGVMPATTDAQALSHQASAVARATTERPVEVELRSAARVLAPGDTAAIAIRLRPEPGWHAYWRHAGDVGSPPSIEWQLPEGYTAAPLRWPTPELIVSPPLASYGYEREVHLLGAVHVPSTARVGSTVKLAGTVTWVVCKVECVADDVELALTLGVGATAITDTAVARAFAAEDARVPVRLADWVFQSVVDSGAIVLRVRPPEGSGLLTSVDKSHVRFFVDSGGIIDHGSPAEVRVDGDALEVRLVRSSYARGTPARLTGVLVLADQADGDEGLSVEVDAPVMTMAQLASAGGSAGAGFGSDRVLEAGGWLALATAAVLALLGGTLLNLMPCVLPVLSIKAFGVAEAAAHDARAARRHALLFAAGVLVSMWALVGVLLALRAAGAEVGWGYQLQSPAMVGALALLVFAAALNMIGVFELTPVGGRLSVAAGRTPPAAEAFMSGVLVTALATPCSAPFLAAAVAYGITGGAASAIVVFTALGLGLVWPLALVAAMPRVRRWLPKPGGWMVTLRQVLAFPLLATVVWLAWVLGRQAGTDAVTALLAALTVLAFGLWALGHFGTLVAPVGRRRAAHAFALATIAGALALVIVGASATPARGAAASDAMSPTIQAEGALPWRPYSAAALTALRDSGRVVLLDFTADWCLTCKVNERVAFGSDTVRASLRAHDVALLRADWTTRDPSVTRALAAFRRNSVPFVVLYGRDSAAAPVVLPTLLTPGIVTRALDVAARE